MNRSTSPEIPVSPTVAGDLPAVRRFFEAHPRLLVISHVRPDGDAYGSSLALTLWLRERGHDVVVVNSDGLSPAFCFLPGSEMIRRAHEIQPEADRPIVAVDCADLRRLGPEFDSWQRTVDLNIDHHLSNPGYGRLNLVDPAAPATAQVLYELIADKDSRLSPAVAANLYVGLMTDTGSFRYRQTTARTFAVASALVAAGADPTDLAQNCYQSFGPSRLRLLREALNGMKFAFEDRVGWFVLDPAIVARSGAKSDDAEGFIDYLQGIKTVQAAFLIEALPDGLTRASLRSRGAIDVQMICQQFGGGGHRLAAGLRTRLSPAELEPKLLSALEKQLAVME